MSESIKPSQPEKVSPRTLTSLTLAAALVVNSPLEARAAGWELLSDSIGQASEVDPVLMEMRGLSYDQGLHYMLDIAAHHPKEVTNLFIETNSGGYWVTPQIGHEMSVKFSDTFETGMAFLKHTFGFDRISEIVHVHTHPVLEELPEEIARNIPPSSNDVYYAILNAGLRKYAEVGYDYSQTVVTAAGVWKIDAMNIAVEIKKIIRDADGDERIVSESPIFQNFQVVEEQIKRDITPVYACERSSIGTVGRDCADITLSERQSAIEALLAAYESLGVVVTFESRD